MHINLVFFYELSTRQSVRISIIMCHWSSEQLVKYYFFDVEKIWEFLDTDSFTEILDILLIPFYYG